MTFIYRLLLKLYPAKHRSSFGKEMLSVFEQASADHRQRGRAAWLRFADCRVDRPGLGRSTSLVGQAGR